MRVISVLAVTALLASCERDASAGARPASVASGPVAKAPDAASTVAGHAPRRQAFRDWLASCDNIGTCHAFAPAIENTGWTRITMPAGPDAQPEVLVGFWPENGAFAGPMTARVDTAVFEAQIDRAPDAPSYAAIPSGRARALVEAVSQGRTMSLNAGPESVALSLNGSAASLLWIDEQQGRLGTTTALIRKGDRPASSVPAAPPAPRVTPAPAAAQAGYGDVNQTLPPALATMPAVVQCRADTDFNPEAQKAVTSARLDAATVLWGVPCGLGAYNFSHIYFTARPDGSAPRPVSFPAAMGEPETELVNAAYDPATRVLSAFNKGRGLGDCGEAESWTWTATGFVLSAASEMPQCWGVPSRFWPTSWVSR